MEILRLSGADLAASFAKLRPEAPILLMSGYSDRALGTVPVDAMIQKPFTPRALLRCLRETLNKRLGIAMPPSTAFHQVYNRLRSFLP